jgi:large repetitive protein
MVMNITPKRLLLSVMLMVLLMTCNSTLSQSIVIGTPTLGFSQACASSGFNTYNVSFTFFPAANVQTSNQFIVELSDASGNFSSATTLRTLTATTSPVNTNFSFPENTAGEGYRIRVRSTAPVATSPASSAFSAYFAVHNQPFSINNNVGTVSLCEGGTHVLSVNNTGNASSPVFFPQLTYIWYRNFTVINSATGPQLTVSQAGNYYAIVDYGSCVMNSYSNIVTVEMISGFNLTINTIDNTDFICQGSSKTLVASNQNTSFQYQWYKDNHPISGANAATYAATQEGTYKLIITAGSCTFESNDFFLELIELLVELDVNPIEYLIPDSNLTVNAITNGVNPTFQWKRNGTNIAGATNASLNITQPGIYIVVVNSNQGCNLTSETSFEVKHPENYQLIIAETGDYQACISTQASLNISVFNAVTGATNFNLLNNTFGYQYQWFRNNQAAAGATQNTIELNSISQNGTYHLRVTLPGVAQPLTSNSINIHLGSSTPLVITQNGSYCNTSTPITFQSSITGNDFQFQWFRNNTAISGANNASYTTTQTGSYHLVVNYGSCQLTSNVINIQGPSGTLNITNNPIEVLLPGNQILLESTTNLNQPSYQWYLNNNPIASATGANYTATTAGTYKLIAIQSVGCAITIEATVSVVFPDSFALVIHTGSGYQNCSSSETVVTIQSLTAQSSNGNITMDANQGSLAFQWQRNNININGAQSTSYNVNQPAQSGTYRLQLTLPGFGVVMSNELNVALQLPAVTITSQGSLCGNGSLQLSSNLTQAEFTYVWRRNGVVISGANQATLNVTQIGEYQLTVSHTGCTQTSNTISINETTITAQLNVSATEILLPGQTRMLTVTTDAVAPSFVWYRNNILIAGANTSSYEATQSGTYRVVVTQTEGCQATQEAVANLIYPDSFSVVIAPLSNYQSCSSNTTSLQITQFIAQTQLGPVTLTHQNLGYGFQWIYNQNNINSATQAEYQVTSNSGNGIYQLRITIPEFNPVFSNEVTVQLGVNENFIITAESEFICPQGDAVLLMSDFSNPSYQLEWYRVGQNQSIGNSQDILVENAGSYFVRITHEGCIYTSNTIQIQEVDSDVITISEPNIIELFDGASKTVYAFGGEQHTWYQGNQIIGVGNQITITEEGNYMLVATLGNCEFVMHFEAVKIINNSFVVPNVVTMNNDGRNDFWSIPPDYTNKENVEVIIYNSQGKVIFRSRNYQNNWPNNSFATSKKDPVVYYTISENDAIIKKGSITIIQ